MVIFGVRTILVYILVIFAMRLMGKRQLGELQPTELVTTFLISNLASICIEDTAQPLAASILPVLIIAALEVFNSALCFLFPNYSRLLEGKPVSVIRDGIIDQKALASLRITGNDLVSALRAQSVFSPQEVYLALVETDGTLSVYPAGEGENQPMIPIIVDGCLLHGNLKLLEKEPEWVKKYLQAKSLKVSQVYLLLASQDNCLCIEKEG